MISLTFIRIVSVINSFETITDQEFSTGFYIRVELFKKQPGWLARPIFASHLCVLPSRAPISEVVPACPPAVTAACSVKAILVPTLLRGVRG